MNLTISGIDFSATVYRDGPEGNHPLSPGVYIVVEDIRPKPASVGMDEDEVRQAFCEEFENQQGAGDCDREEDRE